MKKLISGYFKEQDETLKRIFLEGCLTKQDLRNDGVIALENPSRVKHIYAQESGYGKHSYMLRILQEGVVTERIILIEDLTTLKNYITLE